ncbi:uncharacterized protein LOC143306018 isoform X1 [Osmia lignaria lignaria]|uniref:uncharacterized protein LOC117602289 isoform X1 n=1 Tax=Osmia lignaria lignaria TaxID=1437193 RepID=UPI00402B9C68
MYNTIQVQTFHRTYKPTRKRNVIGLLSWPYLLTSKSHTPETRVKQTKLRRRMTQCATNRRTRSRSDVSDWSKSEDANMNDQSQPLIEVSKCFETLTLIVRERHVQNERSFEEKCCTAPQVDALIHTATYLIGRNERMPTWTTNHSHW